MPFVQVIDAWFQPQRFQGPIPADAQPMIVREVLSGDTVVLSNPRPGPQVPDWGAVSVRLIGGAQRGAVAGRAWP